MTDLNKLFIVGNLTRDLSEKDFAYISTGNARANVTIAVNRSKKNGDQWENEASFFDVTIWGKTAENLRPYLVKGKRLLIEGYLKQDRWEKDGEKKSKIAINAENVYLMGANKKDDPNGDDPPTIQASAATAEKIAKAFNGAIVSNGGDFEEDIPF